MKRFTARREALHRAPEPVDGASHTLATCLPASPQGANRRPAWRPFAILLYNRLQRGDVLDSQHCPMRVANDEVRGPPCVQDRRVEYPNDYLGFCWGGRRPRF